MLTQHQIETFETKGLIRLDGFLEQDKVAAAQKFIFGLAEKEGFWRDGVWQVDKISDRPKFIKPMHKAKLDTLMTDRLLTVINMLVDGQALDEVLLRPPALLFTSPQKTEWAVPASAWHLDTPRLPGAGLPGVQVFTFLDTVIPQGGGTLVVAGSHRLLNTGKFISSQNTKKMLKREPYFRNLLSKDFSDRNRFLTTTEKVDDTELLGARHKTCAYMGR